MPKEFELIYLVQRCILPADRYPKASKRFSDNVELEYMGSAEFEWGVLPKSLREMAGDDFGIIKLKSILDEKNRPLCVYSNLNVLQFPIYEDYLKQLRAGKYETFLKEPSYFEDVGPGEIQWLRTNVWWDCTNNVIWTFEKKLANVLHQSIQASVAWMDEQKKKPEYEVA